MGVPLIVWAGIALTGLGGTGWVVKETGDTVESMTTLAKWATIAGGVYVSYRAVKAVGVLK